MLDELYDIDELQPEFVEETEKPYDKYLKLHNYDPKTNTVEIDGKRVNAGARNISNKAHNRMNKILRENDYDPKTSTYKSDIKVKNPKTGNVENQRVKLNFNPHKSTQASTWSDQLGVDFDTSNINMPPKTLKQKPKSSGSTLKHEERHVNDYNDRVDYGRINLSDNIKDIKDEARRANKKDFKDLKYSKYSKQMQHANDPDEKYADLYGELHSKQGFGGTKMTGGRYKNNYKDPVSEERKNKLQERIDKLEKERGQNLYKYKAMQDVISSDSNYGRIQDDRNEIARYIKIYETRVNMSPEERLEKARGFSPEKIEELKKSGKLEDALKDQRMDDEEVESRLKYYKDKYSDYTQQMRNRRDELLKNDDFREKIDEKISEREKDMDETLDAQIGDMEDQLYNKKNFDAEVDSRTQFVERKIRELAEKDPEVKRKLAEYDAAMDRRKQKFEKRKANKAEAREKEARRAQVQTEYYLDDIEISW